MSVQICRSGEGTPFDTPGHVGVRALQQLPAANGDIGVLVLHARYDPGGLAEMSPTVADSIYAVQRGELVLIADGIETVLRPGDVVHLPAGTMRSVQNRASAAATLLVVRLQPRPRSRSEKGGGGA
jgi:uncharacterized cupin superfamily protein